MKTFQELIDEFPSRKSVTYNPKTTNCHDNIITKYNNLWGALSDTHMTKIGDEYIITGNRVNTYDWFRYFLTTNQYDGNHFPEGSFAYYMMQRGLCGYKSIVNGQVVFIIRFWESQQSDKPNPVFLDGYEVGPQPQVLDTVTYPVQGNSNVDDI